MSSESETENFIKLSSEIHEGIYNYSKVKYLNSRTKVCIICPKHGEFWQAPSNHLQNKGCIHCGIVKSRKNRTSNTKKFIQKAESVHGDKYDYSKVEYKNARTKVKILCKKHGYFHQSPDNHVSKKSGCPICRSSKGEIKIRKILTDRNISFIEQYRFSDCRNKLPLPFDFYLPNFNTCIEYDGEQHFKNKKCFGGIKEFNNRIQNDKIKTEYCKENNIRLIRIKYDDDDLKEIIYSILT